MPGTAPRTCSTREASVRSTARSGPNTLTARLVRDPDIMWSIRWLIGCPKETVVPGIVATARRISATSSSLLRPSPSGARTTSISDALNPLHVLVFLGTPGPAAGRNHLGEGEERFLHLAPQPVALGERNPRRADDGNGERSLVERGQEAAAQTGHERGHGHDHDDHQQENRPTVPEAPVESRRVPRSQSAQEPGLAGTKHLRPAQQKERQHRRDRQRHHERGRERRDEGEAERPEQPALQAPAGRRSARRPERRPAWR